MPYKLASANNIPMAPSWASCQTEHSLHLLVHQASTADRNCRNKLIMKWGNWRKHFSHLHNDRNMIRALVSTCAGICAHVCMHVWDRTCHLSISSLWMVAADGNFCLRMSSIFLEFHVCHFSPLVQVIHVLSS